MNNLPQLVIEENRNFLQQDLLDDIIHDCIGILSSQEKRLIFVIDDEDGQVTKFLEIMSNKSETELMAFVKNLKPYYSWLYSRLIKSIKKFRRKKVYHVLNLGCVPYPCPLPNVRRIELEKTLEKKLKELKTGHYVILHGMIGCGKTSLAVQVLKNYSLIESFGRVFWLSVGLESNLDPSSLQRDLNNLLPEPVSQLSTNPVIGKKLLTRWFHDKNLTNSLIVLNGVRDETIVDYVAVGSKFLIITSDKNIITSSRQSICTFINVNEGFSLSETHELCSAALKNSEIPKNFRKYINQLHACTKGHPFTLSLIVSQFGDFKDDLLRNNERWINYVNIFKEINRRRGLQGLDMIYKAIDAIVENLDSKDKDYFFKLAVFPEDVNIRPEVLATLWGLETKYLAENIMQHFVNKSLALKKWNKPQNSYMFGLHQLVVDFLSKRLKTEDENKKLHRYFISQYERLCGGIWSKLPSDNYIFYYIGYHLQKAGMNDVFPKIYFNLEFLQEKLRVTGPADVIWDFQKYQQLILSGASNPEIYNEFFFFIEHYGVWIYQGIDILQAALQMPSDTSVFQNGKQVSLKNTSYYLRFFNCVNEVVPQTLFLTEEIVDVCFGRSLDEALVATASNCVEIYNLKTKGRLCRFTGHTHQIKCLDISPTSVKCLSASSDKTVRIWTLESNDRSTPPLPSNRQRDYMPLTGTESETKSDAAVLEHSNPLMRSLFSKRSDNLVASLCVKGEITVWENCEKKWCQTIADIKSIDFDVEDRFIFASMSTFIYQLCTKTGEIYRRVGVNFTDFISLNTIQSPTEEYVILTKHTIEMKKMCASVDKEEEVDFQEMELPFPKSKFFKLSSNGQNIAVGDEDGLLILFNSCNGSIITYIEPQRQRKLVNFCVREQAVLTGHCNKMVTLYPIDVLPSQLNKLKWAAGSGPVLAKVDVRNNNVEVYEEDKIQKKIEFNKSVEMMDILGNGKAIVVARRDGHILFQRMHSCKESIILDSGKIPSKLLLISSEDKSTLVLINYYNEKTLLWKERDNTTIEINQDTLQLKGIILDAVEINSAKQILIMIQELVVTYTLDGQFLHSLNLNELYCINTKINAVAVSSPIGLSLIHFGENGHFLDKEIIEDDRHIELMAFSPSGIKLAVIRQDGTGKVYDYNSKCWWKFRVNNLLNQPKCLAVSDTGHVCYSGGGLVSIVSPHSVFTTAILDLSVIIADPTGSDIFAVLDKTGTVRKIKQENVGFLKG